MIDLTNIKVMEGGYEIIYSGDFNIYEKNLELEGILDLKFIFSFEKDTNKSTPHYEVNSVNKVVNIKLFNFDNIFGSGIPQKIHIANTSDNKELFFSFYCKSIGDETSLLKVLVTFYLR
jgi:hypothetical protein